MKSYAEDPGHYKRLIAKINSEINFSGYLLSLGHRMIKRSAGSAEFELEGNRIVLQTKRQPVTYFNRSDSQDKGQFFVFLRNRSKNFYEAIREGLDSIQRSYELEPEINTKRQRQQTKSLEARYHIGPLTRLAYLTDERGFEKDTLESQTFQGRLFNAFHIRDNQGRIANIAVPRYGLDGSIKNYTLYNRPYTDKRDGKTKKFRLFLNERYEYLFVSNPDVKVEKVVCFESAFDALAYHELHGHPDCFYISLSGYIDQRKLDQFFQWIKRVDADNDLPLHLGFDHDMEGMRYDLQLLSAWLNRHSDKVHMGVSWQRPLMVIQINYLKPDLSPMERDSDMLNGKIYKLFGSCPKGAKKALCFKDKIVWEMNLENILKLGNDPLVSRVYWKTAIEALSKTYTDGYIKMDKAPSLKDWNDQLISVKKKYAPQKGSI